MPLLNGEKFVALNWKHSMLIAQLVQVDPDLDWLRCTCGPYTDLEDFAEVLDALLETPGGIAWGVYTLAAAIKFLNIDCNIVHGQVQDESGRGMEAHGQSGKRDAGPPDNGKATKSRCRFSPATAIVTPCRTPIESSGSPSCPLLHV